MILIWCVVVFLQLDTQLDTQLRGARWVRVKDVALFLHAVASRPHKLPVNVNLCSGELLSIDKVDKHTTGVIQNCSQMGYKKTCEGKVWLGSCCNAAACRGMKKKFSDSARSPCNEVYFWRGPLYYKTTRLLILKSGKPTAKRIIAGP